MSEEIKKTTSTPSSAPAGTTAMAGFKDKFIQLAKTAQFAWFMGNLSTIWFSLLYFLSYRTKVNSWNSIYYKLIYVSVLQSFGIILYNSYTSANGKLNVNVKNVNVKTIQKMFNDENFVYFLIALNLLFILPRCITLSIFPFLLFSTFHTIIYFKDSLLPILPISETTKKSLGDKLSGFLTRYHNLSLYQAANFEILTLFYIFFKALIWSKGCWIALAVYGTFIKIRDEKNPVTRNIFKQWEVRIDGLAAHPSLPLQVREVWVQIKQTLKKVGGVRVVSATAPSAAKEQ